MAKKIKPIETFWTVNRLGQLKREPDTYGIEDDEYRIPVWIVPAKPKRKAKAKK